MGQSELTALGEHNVEIERERKALPELERELVELDIAVEQIIGSHDRRVTSHIPLPM